MMYQKYRLEIERVYYANTTNIEQTLDIYRPIVIKNNNNLNNFGNGITTETNYSDSNETTTTKTLPIVDENTTTTNNIINTTPQDENDPTTTTTGTTGSTSNSGNNNVIIVLVVGYGWIGYFTIIHILLDWFVYSYGPTLLSKYMGYTCVCIHHRGTFPNCLPQLFVTIPNDNENNTNNNSTSMKSKKRKTTKQTATTFTKNPQYNTTSNKTSSTIRTDKWSHHIIVSVIVVAAYLVCIVVGSTGSTGNTNTNTNANISSNSTNYTSPTSIFTFHNIFVRILIIITIVLSIKYWIEIHSISSVTFDTMIDDVAIALQWIQNNTNSILNNNNKNTTSTIIETETDTLMNTTISNDNNKKCVQLLSTPTILLGGYSSGGHVLASLLQIHPDILQSKYQLTVSTICHGCFYISSIFSTYPYIDPLQQQQLQQLQRYPIDDNCCYYQMPQEIINVTSSIESESQIKVQDASSSSLYPPGWFVRIIFYCLFGWRQKQQQQSLSFLLSSSSSSSTTTANMIPSPIHTIQMTPSVPHLIFDCHQEKEQQKDDDEKDKISIVKYINTLFHVLCTSKQFAALLHEKLYNKIIIQTPITTIIEQADDDIEQSSVHPLRVEEDNVSKQMKINQEEIDSCHPQEPVIIIDEIDSDRDETYYVITNLATSVPTTSATTGPPTTTTTTTTTTTGSSASSGPVVVVPSKYVILPQSKYIPIQNTNHFCILSSIGLQQSLKDHLPLFIKHCISLRKINK